jgi:sec-independent protein translocase protein TatC
MAGENYLDKFSEAPFLDHLEELRWRLIKSIIAIVIGGIAAYFISDYLFQGLWYPLHKVAPELKIHYFRVTEAFTTRLKLSIVAGAIIASPIVFYQVWRFILPGLYEREAKIVLPIVFASTVFFLLGGVFCYLVMLPYGLSFFYGQAPPDTEPTLMMGDYLGFILTLILSFGIVFELPVVSFFLGRVGILTSEFMGKWRRYAIVIIAILAAVITPPDFISQIAVGVPLYILYEISIIVVKVTGRGEKRRKAKKDLAG